MLKVGIVGLGFMGWIHWLSYKQVAGVKVVAICETDPTKRTGDWTSIQGNFGPPGEKVDLSDIQVFDNVDSMLSECDLDFVDVCLPPSMHRPATVKSLDHGKHVFCEKPMAVSLDDCDQMVAAAQRNNRLLMVGHVLPFFPEYTQARAVIDSGEYGRLLGGTFRRVISDPTWLSNFYDAEIVGGPLIDLHVHDAHLIRMLFGMPTQLDCVGRFRGDVVQYCNTVYRFDDPNLVVSSVSGVVEQQGRPFNHGFELHFESATMQFEFAAFADQAESMPLKLLTPDDQVERPELVSESDIDGFKAEIQEVVESVSQNKQSEILSGHLAKDAIRLCHLQTESARRQTPVSI